MRVVNWFNENRWLVIILIVGAALRFYRADFQSLWLDEILSMNDANPNLTWQQFYDGIMFWEFIPHLYFALLRLVFEIFGFTSLVARIFTACIGVGGIYAIFLLGKEFFSKNTGLVAAGLLAVNIFHISYSQEVRPYGMLFLFTVLAFYRLLILLRNINIRNAIYYGIFAGLIINSHFFGFITLFAQAIIILFFLIKSEKNQRLHFFLHALFAGLIIILVAFPAYDAILRTSEIQSFWLPVPAADAYSKMFMEFFGNSEMVLFVVNFIVIYYFVRLFSLQSTDNSYKSIISDKMLSSALLLFVWLGVSLVIPLMRSHLDVPMILSRYFINIVPAIIIVIAIGIILIRNRIIKSVVLATILVLCMIDIFVVNNYYNEVKKTQFRELTQELIKQNPDKIKVVTFYSWLFPYFLAKDSIQIEGKTFEDHIIAMKSGAVAQQAFWYADVNARPFSLAPEHQAYLEQNFILDKKLEFHDAWAYLYRPKITSNINSALDLSQFHPGTLDERGHMILFENAVVKSPFIELSKGRYDLVIVGRSTPDQPINGESAHIKIRVNGRNIGEFNLGEDQQGTERRLALNIEKDERIRLQLIYDNDIVVDGKDRNAILQSVKIEKK